VTLRSRLRAIEKQTAAATRRDDHFAAVLAEMDRDRAAFLTHIPADLRPRVSAALANADGPQGESLSSWQLWPFARWAGPVPAGFVFPPAFVAWLLDPPRDFWMGHTCGRCGMSVPLYFTHNNDPDPPPALSPFPTCPACGGRTSHAAHYRPDPTDPEGGIHAAE
jgi:hypothetical protein